MNIDEQIKKLREESDNYNQALEALKAFAHEMLWDDNAKALSGSGKASFGRRMHRRHSDGMLKKVTPDLVAQNEPGKGCVAEVKASLPENSDYRKEKLLDVTKYDCELQGWESTPEQPTTHDLILLVDYPNSPTAKADLDALRQEKKFSPKMPFSLISFTQTPRAGATWIALQSVDGGLSDPVKQQKLKNICMIHPEDILANPLFGRVLLYDARPPLPLLMNRLYAAINGDLTEDESLALREQGQLEKKYTLAQLKMVLGEYCCPKQTDYRVPSLPDTAWLKDVMKLWVKMKWAKKVPGNGGYEILLKKRRDPYEQFLKTCAQEDCKAASKRVKEAAKKLQQEADWREKYPLFAQPLNAGGEEGEKSAAGLERSTDAAGQQVG